jgi:hypothetical protein
MFADRLDYVVGVDTHRDAHALAVVCASTGAVLGEREVGAERRGYERALALAREQAVGERLWAIEGSGSYGANNRLIHDPETRAYATRRTAEGLSRREILRCLKATSPAGSTDSSSPTSPPQQDST